MYSEFVLILLLGCSAIVSDAGLVGLLVLIISQVRRLKLMGGGEEVGIVSLMNENLENERNFFRTNYFSE